MKEKLKFLIRGKRELRLILPFVAILLSLVLVSALSIDAYRSANNMPMQYSFRYRAGYPALTSVIMPSTAMSVARNM
jgi:hypothetical protein